MKKLWYYIFVGLLLLSSIQIGLGAETIKGDFNTQYTGTNVSNTITRNGLNINYTSTTPIIIDIYSYSGAEETFTIQIYEDSVLIDSKQDTTNSEDNHALVSFTTSSTYEIDVIIINSTCSDYNYIITENWEIFTDDFTRKSPYEEDTSVGYIYHYYLEFEPLHGDVSSGTITVLDLHSIDTDYEEIQNSYTKIYTTPVTQTNITTNINATNDLTSIIGSFSTTGSVNNTVFYATDVYCNNVPSIVGLDYYTLYNSGEDVELDYTKFDLDVDTVTETINWYKNGTIQSDLLNINPLYDNKTTDGDIWFATISVSDTNLTSTNYTTNNIYIRDYSLTSIQLQKNSPLYTDDDVIILIDVSASDTIENASVNIKYPSGLEQEFEMSVVNVSSQTYTYTFTGTSTVGTYVIESLILTIDGTDYSIAQGTLDNNAISFTTIQRSSGGGGGGGSSTPKPVVNNTNSSIPLAVDPAIINTLAFYIPRPNTDIQEWSCYIYSNKRIMNVNSKEFSTLIDEEERSYVKAYYNITDDSFTSKRLDGSVTIISVSGEMQTVNIGVSLFNLGIYLPFEIGITMNENDITNLLFSIDNETDEIVGLRILPIILLILILITLLLYGGII